MLRREEVEPRTSKRASGVWEDGEEGVLLGADRSWIEGSSRVGVEEAGVCWIDIGRM